MTARTDGAATGRDDAAEAEHIAEWHGSDGTCDWEPSCLLLSAPRIEYIDDLSICGDCLMLIASGLERVDSSWCDRHCDGSCETARDNYLAAVELNWPDNDGWHLTTGSRDCEWCSGPDEEDCEGWFSMSSCDICNSRLGGTRYHATAWREIK